MTYEKAQAMVEWKAATLYEEFENALIDFGKSLTSLLSSCHFSQQEYRLIIGSVAFFKRSVQDHGRRDASLGVGIPPEVASKSLCEVLNAVRNKSSSDQKTVDDAKAQLIGILSEAETYTKHITENDMLALNHKVGDREFLESLAQVGWIPRWIHAELEFPVNDIMEIAPDASLRLPSRIRGW